MAVKQEKSNVPSTILESIWASFINGGTNTSHEERTHLPRLPSLGRWISIGAENSDELLDGIIRSDGCEPSRCPASGEDARSASKPKVHTAEEAALAYDKAALRMRGSRAHLNFPLKIVNDCLAETHFEDDFSCANGRSVCLPRKRARNGANSAEILTETQELKRMASNEGIDSRQAYVLELQDLGEDYMESLMSSL